MPIEAMSNEVISIKTTNNFKDSVTKETSVYPMDNEQYLDINR